MTENVRKMSGSGADLSAGPDDEMVGAIKPFLWTRNRDKAAQALARGHTQMEAAEAAGVQDRTIRRWLEHPDFAAEVDRLTLMTDISTRAERLRLAMRAARQKVQKDGGVYTEKDLLDWLKFAQSETDGAKLDLTALLEGFE